ncbi:MAG: hypothetical protein L6V35_09725 [Alistipes putredinis]|nr:MAG: hypothetical protein L6V35_09725 [Alistipes putredinis]
MSNIIIVLIFAAVMIASSIRKSRALQKKAASEQNRTVMPEESDNEWREYDKYETTEERHDAPAVCDAPQPQFYAPAPAPEKTKERMSGETSGEPCDKQPRPQSDKHSFEFDLRRAVIESEILNPKYKQY